MINEKAKIIENNINEILNESEDFVKIHNEFNALLREINNNETNLKQSKIKLLNYLLKHSKRKILFEFILEDGSHKTSYKIGLNNNGLGSSRGSWDNNLKNIGDYYGADRFENLFKNKEFVKEFLKHTNKHLKGKHTAIIKKCLTTNNFTKEPSVKDINGIEINIGGYRGNYISYSSKNTSKIIILINEKEMEDYTFSFRDLKNFIELINNKKEIIIYLGRELKEYKEVNDKIKVKLAEIKKGIAPYKALEEI